MGIVSSFLSMFNTDLDTDTSLIILSFLPASPVDVKSEVPVGLEPISPLDLRTDLRMMMPVVDPVVREKQLQQELLLIQQQQQIQKQLLIAEFQKQHENLTRQHQAQLQEHIKVADVSLPLTFALRGSWVEEEALRVVPCCLHMPVGLGGNGGCTGGNLGKC